MEEIICEYCGSGAMEEIGDDLWMCMDCHKVVEE